MTTIDVQIPDIGDFKDVRVVELLVKAGDAVKKDSPLITLETDKATMDVPSPAAGVVAAVRVKVDDLVSKGSVILTLDSAGAAKSAAPVSANVEAPSKQAVAPAAAAAPASAPSPATAVTGPALVRASPAVRKAARERGIDLTTIAATGFGGRLSKEDFENATRRSPSASGSSDGDLPPWPPIDNGQFGPVERKPLSRLKRIAGANLARNWRVIPHVTNFDEADITDLESFRTNVNSDSKSSRDPAIAGTKLTVLAFLLKASAVVLKRYPIFNASLDGDSLVYRQYVHLGFAADTPDGLVVPVIRDVDKKGLLEIARETSALATRAREGKLKLGDMQGGGFTISSLGGIGGTGFTPIINAPEVAILGANKAQMKPVWDGSAFQPRLMLPIALSWDHRVIDGAAAARFLVDLAALLADFRRVSL